jgi:hypothetical protein
MKKIVAIISAFAIFYEIMDIFKLLRYQRELQANGIADVSQITSEIEGNFVVMFVFVCLCILVFRIKDK